MKPQPRIRKQIENLLYQALETERGGVEVYRLALLCARRPDLKSEWGRYLADTERHVSILGSVLDSLGLDPDAVTPGRLIVRDKGRTLLAAMQKALKDDPLGAEIVAAECIVDAETKDHANWQLLGALAGSAPGSMKKPLASAYEEVAGEEDEHLYHAHGWCRELWLESLGLPAELPPIEEKRHVRSAPEAARAREERSPKLRKNVNGGRRPQPSRM